MTDVRMQQFAAEVVSILESLRHHIAQAPAGAAMPAAEVTALRNKIALACEYHNDPAAGPAELRDAVLRIDESLSDAHAANLQEESFDRAISACRGYISAMPADELKIALYDGPAAFHRSSTP